MIYRRIHLRFWTLILASLCSATALSSSYKNTSLFPDTGETAIHLRVGDVRGGPRVLVVSLRPGDEDLETLAYLRLAAKAHIVSGYVTNGESGDPDQTGTLPRDLAAARRNETAAALMRLEVAVHFLCLPDPGAVADTASLGELWNRDLLSLKLDDMLMALKPHVVILSQDRDGGRGSRMWEYVRALLGERIQNIRARNPGVWRVDRYWIDEGAQEGLPVPAGRRNTALGRTYRNIAQELDTGFISQRVQRRMRKTQVTYTSGLPSRGKQPASLIGNLDLRVPAQLRSLQAWIRSYARDVERRRNSTKTLQERMVSVMDSVDGAIAPQTDRTGTVWRVLLDWKSALEHLRNALLGVTARYSISEQILTERQLTHVRIESVTGLQDGGSTTLYFPATDKGWILNEGLTSKLPLTVPGEYRLITPERVLYDLPWGTNNLHQEVPVRPMMLFLLHVGKSRAQSFVYRIALPFRYAPRFTVEMLTPIVRCFPGEYLVARLTNHSRDGVRDTIAVRDSRVVSDGAPFRLNAKEVSVTDTLRLRWLDTVAGGTQLIPVSIGGIKVAEFASRQFQVHVDSTKRVVLLSAIDGSPTADALRRLGLPRLRVVRTPEQVTASIDECDVLVVDRRVTSLWPESTRLRPLLEDLTQRGKHVLILAQDDVSWDAYPLWDQVMLARDASLAADVALERDSLHAAMRVPNVLSDSDFHEWIFSRGYNSVKTKGSPGLEIPLYAGKKRPLIVTAVVHAGRMTYVDLALGPQWMSVHPGSLRMLANLLSL